VLIWQAFAHVWIACSPQHESLTAAVAAEWGRLQSTATVDRVQIDNLVRRLERLSPAQTLALIDAFERFQARVQREGWRPMPQLLQEVGLLGG
jgi:hypothetical protein